ncbi:hypothetical protein [Methanosarcina horonobensis]|uniref:hypothetical protein n=1 Tax=Methanosarcina horonobensis TaxID=418008 RepID=UPI000A46D605|nr:hypothetical protein [Methanosarcina horonobensis]
MKKKDLWKRSAFQEIKKEVVLELTEFGKEAFEWHRSLHESMEAGIRKELEKNERCRNKDISQSIWAP